MAPGTIQKKTVLITGCSTGSIGWALTKSFLAHDFHVFAGVRSRFKAKDLAELSNVDLVELDVTVSQTILECKELVAERTGGKLDVLVGVPISYVFLASQTRPLATAYTF
jgi:1-acylglycerone phosphate reductase